MKVLVVGANIGGAVAAGCLGPQEELPSADATSRDRRKAEGRLAGIGRILIGGSEGRPREHKGASAREAMRRHGFDALKDITAWRRAEETITAPPRPSHACGQGGRKPG